MIPKLIEQPTWGGTYIVEAKHWNAKKELAGKKIGQSYELYDKSNLSLVQNSSDSSFFGEIADPKLVKEQSSIAGTLPISQLIAADPEGVLGSTIVSTYGNSMHLLLKFTQALGNSFQLHIADGVAHPRWKPKPESWYYFEPGLITCGVRSDVQWEDYQTAVTELDVKTREIAAQVQSGGLSYDDGKKEIASLVKRYNPWQYVNLVRVEKGTLLDLSPCGIHHSWEEDLESIPLGNVLYEIQLNVMDDVATIRSFDKGKMSKDGALRPLQIDDYFALADRSREANNPKTHMRAAKNIARTSGYVHQRLLETKYYSMDRLAIPSKNGSFASEIDSFRHLFVQSGVVDVTAGDTTVSVSPGHSAFIPANCKKYTVRATQPNTEVLISY